MKLQICNNVKSEETVLELWLEHRCGNIVLLSRKDANQAMTEFTIFPDGDWAKHITGNLNDKDI